MTHENSSSVNFTLHRSSTMWSKPFNHLIVISIDQRHTSNCSPTAKYFQEVADSAEPRWNPSIQTLFSPVLSVLCLKLFNICLICVVLWFSFRVIFLYQMGILSSFFVDWETMQFPFEGLYKDIQLTCLELKILAIFGTTKQLMHSIQSSHKDLLPKIKFPFEPKHASH